MTPQIPIDILLVEDSPSDVRFTQEAFDEARLLNRLSVAETGEAALERLRDPALPRPDLILLDLNLPDGSGFELLGELRGEPILADVPVVVLSGEASRSERERLLAAGADEYVTKPFEVRVFVDLLQGLLG